MIGAILVGLVVAAIVWFIAIGPKMTSAQEAREATTAQNDENDRLETTLLQRQKSAENVPDYTRELYAIRDLLPPSEDVPSLRRTLNDIMSSTGLVIEVERLSDPEPIIGGLSLSAPMAQVGLTSEIEGMLFTTLQATSFTIEFEGPLAKAWTVIEKLQSGEHRFMLITGLSISARGDTPEEGVRVIITAVVFTLDEGIPGITVRPDERPWPGTDEYFLELPTGSSVPSGNGSSETPTPEPSESPSPAASQSSGEG